MSRVWNFTDLEFLVLWETVSNDYLPEPLVFGSRTARLDEHLREKRETLDRLQNRIDLESRLMLEALAQPDILVTVGGWQGDGVDDPSGRIRMLAVRRGPNAYLVNQLPGETVWRSGGYTVRAGEALQLAQLVAQALPPRDPGRIDRLVLEVGPAAIPAAQMVPSGRQLSWDPNQHQARDFLRSKRTGAGTIEIVQGSSRFGPRGIARGSLAWRDLAGDGRYAILRGVPAEAYSADAKRIAAFINTRIAEVIRAIRDEHA